MVSIWLSILVNDSSILVITLLISSLVARLEISMVPLLDPAEELLYT